MWTLLVIVMASNTTNSTALEKIEGFSSREICVAEGNALLEQYNRVLDESRAQGNYELLNVSDRMMIARCMEVR